MKYVPFAVLLASSVVAAVSRFFYGSNAHGYKTCAYWMGFSGIVFMMAGLATLVSTFIVTIISNWIARRDVAFPKLDTLAAKIVQGGLLSAGYAIASVHIIKLVF